MVRLSTKPSLETLQAELADPNYKVRKEAIKQMMRHQRKHALEPLLGVLQDGRGDVRASAVQALGKLADARAFLPMLNLLNDKNTQVRAQVALALGNFGDHGVVRPLVDLLNDPHAPIRQYAARSLGKLHDPDSLSALLAYLKRAKAEDDTTELYYAAHAVGNFNIPDAIEPLLALRERSSSSSVQLIIANVLSKQGENTLPLLLEMLADQTRAPQIRSCIAQALAIKPRPEFLQLLLMTLNDTDAATREQATRALEALKDSAAIEPLTRLLDDGVEHVQVAAIRALATLNAVSAVEKLIGVLSTEVLCDFTSNQLIRVTADTLGKLGDSRAAMPLLAVFWRDECASCYSNVTEALCKLRNPEIIEPLLQRLPATRGMLRWNIIRILEHFHDVRAVEPLIALLDFQATKRFEIHFQEQLIKVLGNLGDPRAIEPLYAQLYQTTGSLHAAIWSALSALGVVIPHWA